MRLVFLSTHTYFSMMVTYRYHTPPPCPQASSTPPPPTARLPRPAAS